MRTILIFLGSVLLSVGIVANAVVQKKQFYPSVVYITKSNPSMVVIYFQSLVLVLMLGKLMRKVFLGTLRAAEFEHLMERFWYALTETCLAFTVFRDDFNPKFIALFTVLLFLKSFHWLAEDRVDYMERSPVIGWLFHIRVAGLLNVLGLLDYLLIMYAYQSTITKGATVQLVFGFEYAILITMVANTMIKYVLHATELRSETPWENKAVFLLYTELVVGLIRVLLYIVFVFLMVKIYTLPLFAFRPMYYTIRNFKKALNDVIMSRRAIHNMNTLYPDATADELSMSDNICIICREDMVSSSKKLPCGHIFHTACLRSWFQRQQTCPTCRLNILRTAVTVTPQPVINNNNNNNNNINNNNNNNNNTNVNNNNNSNSTANNNSQNNVRPEAVQNNNPFFNLLSQASLNNPLNASGTTTATSTTSATNVAAPPVLNPFFFQTMPFMAPFALGPPPMPPNLETLTQEELEALEGRERKNVEERIKLLRNIQTMLNASVALMNQYQMVMSNLPPPPVPVSSANEQVPTEPDSSSQDKKSDNTEQLRLAGETDKEISSIKLRDLGSDLKSDEIKFSSDAVPGTSKIGVTITDNTPLLSRSSTNENVAVPSGLSNETNEIRKRRLEKFSQNNN